MYMCVCMYMHLCMYLDKSKNIYIKGNWIDYFYLFIS